MAQRKAFQIDDFIARPEKSFFLILLYGPDQGLVSERAGKLAKNLGFDGNHSMSVIRFEAEDVASDPAKLFDEVFAISMFCEKKLIRIKGVSRKNIQSAFAPILDNPPSDCWIIFEGGDLKRDSALRKLAERSPNAMALPCYQDDDRALEQLVKEEITANNLKMDQEAKEYLLSLLGENRQVSRNELAKLALYAHGQGNITREQIASLLDNVSAIANYDVIDAVSQGKTDFLQTRLNYLLQGDSSPDMLIWGTLRHFQTLHKLRISMEIEKSSPVALVNSIRPPVHFSRRAAVVESLKLWTSGKLESALHRLNTAFHKTRVRPALAESTAATALLAIALQARKKS